MFILKIKLETNDYWYGGMIKDVKYPDLKYDIKNAKIFKSYKSAEKIGLNLWEKYKYNFCVYPVKFILDIKGNF